jgi:clan AA aspartic protease (TIGR02281 family)
MKKLFLVILTSLLLVSVSSAQTKILMEKKGGVYLVPCKINGLPLNFIFDTGASDVSISLTEALFMLKDGKYLKKEDIGDDVYHGLANGDVAIGTKLNLREIEFGGLKLYNVEASIVHELSAPLLLGQSVISRLGKIEMDGNELVIATRGYNTYDYSNGQFKNESNLVSNESNSGKSTIYENPYSLNFSGVQSVFEGCPILDKPYMGKDEQTVGRATKGIVAVIEKYNEKYYRVQSGDLVGYLWAGWFKK